MTAPSPLTLRILPAAAICDMAGGEEAFAALCEDYGLQPIFTGADGQELFDRREVSAALAEHTGAPVEQAPPAAGDLMVGEEDAAAYAGGPELFACLCRDHGLRPALTEPEQLFAVLQIDGALDGLAEQASP